MSEKLLQMPRRLTTVTDVLALRLSKIDLSGIDRCVLDFTRCDFGEPLPMLLLGREIRTLKKNNPEIHLVCRSRSTQFRGYADHISFFKYCGFNRGNHVGEALGSNTYLPIHVFDMDDWKAASGDRPYAEIVEEKSSELAHVLTQERNGGLFTAVQYSLREMMRNSVGHSFGDLLVVFAQYWPAKKVQKWSYTITVSVFIRLFMTRETSQTKATNMPFELH